MGGVTVEGVSHCVNSAIMLRPRGTLAKALYNKYLSDEHLDTLDKNEWYQVERERLKPEIFSLHVPLTLDKETEMFLDTSRKLSNSVLTQLCHSLIKFILGFFMTQTSINGWLGRGSMLVFSTSQFSKLTGRQVGEEGELADLGAGDGTTTKTMSAFFTRVTVTELSKPMRTSLQRAGFRVAEIDSWYDRKYDVVSCLNVLDRCDRPLTLLGQIRAGMKPGAMAIVAIVLPFKPYVEVGTKDHKPIEELPIKGNTFEDQVTSVIEDVLIPSGFIINSWAKVPYLCQGDLNQAYYWLHDAVFTLTLPPLDNKTQY
ncbi:protein-L-histidine N-pros-methyltransferase [Rhodnius prolixus]